MAASEEIDLELLAAFIDGRLVGAERDRALKLLGESEAAFEIYADALHARTELGRESVVPIDIHGERRARRWWTVVPVAAAAALVLAVLPTIQARRADAVLAMRADLIVRPVTERRDLAIALGSGWDEGRWPVMRGGGSILVDSTTAALRLGVRATDLRVALAEEDRGLAGRLTAEILGLLGSVNLSNTAKRDYEGIARQIGNGDPIAQVIDTASRAEQNLDDFLDSRWFWLGRWFAAGELAARTHSTSFFRSPETSRFLEAAIEHGRLVPDDVKLLSQVSVIVRRGVSDNEFETVRQKFAELIQRHGG